MAHFVKFTSVILTVLCLFIHNAVNAQNVAPVQPDAIVYVRSDDSLAIRIYYPQGVDRFNKYFAKNEDAVGKFVSIYRQKFCGRPLFISASVSLEGGDAVNDRLAVGRADALMRQLKDRLDIPDSLYVIGKLTSRYPSSNIDVGDYPSLRYAEAVVGTQADYQYVVNDIPPEPESEPEPVVAVEPEPEPVVVAEPEPEPAVTLKPSPEYIRKPLFALKTNLLFDAVTAVNVEVEIPIGRRVSIAGEWIFPDWVDRETNEYCLQANIKSIEPRFWFGKRQETEKLTGHFIGVYGQWGDFDFQPFTEKGYRCYNGWAVGVSYGFAHSISQRHSLRLEYSIGIGYAFADYCLYQREADHTIIATKDEWHYNTSLFPIPTKAKMSLVWMIYYKNRCGEKNFYLYGLHSGNASGIVFL